MDDTRKSLFIAGIFFLLTFVSSIGALPLYAPLLNDARYVLGGGADTSVFTGAVFEIVLCITNIGTAVVLFPILKRQNEAVALGYVASRIVESTLIAIGIISLLTVVSLRQGFGASAGADSAAVLTAAQALVAVHAWTFLLGPGLLSGSTGLLLGYLFYRSGLFPRPVTLLGLIGGPLVILSAIGVLFGLYSQLSTVSFVLTLPEILWELTLGFWLTLKGLPGSRVAMAAG